MPQFNKLHPKALAKYKKRFLRFFPKAFGDQRYEEWERAYKWEAHKLFIRSLNKESFAALLRHGEYAEIARRALQVESGTTFLFSFEKMALRDALRTTHGAKIFSEGLYGILYGSGPIKQRFIEWIIAVSELPRIKSRVLSWPVLTVLPYLAQPTKHMVMKPSAMRFAAEELGYDLNYSSKPNYGTYERLIHLADLVGEGIADLHPRNYHDLQTFLWVMGSAEYDRLSGEI